ncbi:hypothetical protein ACZ87_02783 [Candidatus Erwinia dacicola]|uniref:Uncharacterized protein n=1 Tax=Candidatus Erwinia dacicola TaxID=252393 RepID=A0A328TN82_9GAMM|nr:hypothetical protein ACZ87_02783 [Candidatus Erwinia dacicola]
MLNKIANSLIFKRYHEISVNTYAHFVPLRGPEKPAKIVIRRPKAYC